MVMKRASRIRFYSMIFMDCEMPVMNGYEATEILRKKMFDKEIPYCSIIGCTALSSDEVISSTFKVGMECVVTKPIAV